MFSPHQTIALPSILCTLEVRWKNNTVPKTWLNFYTSTMRARCHDVVMGSCEVLNKQLTGIVEPQPSLIQISQCYPNPIGLNTLSKTNLTSIQFSLQSNEHIRAVLYDQIGRIVKVLIDEMFEEGSHNMQIETHSLQAGRYNVVIECGKQTVHREFVVVK